MTESETDIVRQAKAGDHAAFGQLFQRYRRPVLSFLYGMTNRRDLTEDLLQETVSRAFVLLPNLREESKFSTWLFGIARNVARERDAAGSATAIGLTWRFPDRTLFRIPIRTRKRMRSGGSSTRPSREDSLPWMKTEGLR